MKENIIKPFEEIIKKAKNQTKRTNLHTDKIVSVIRKSIELLGGFEEKVEGADGNYCETIANYRDAVRGIIKDNKKGYIWFKIVSVSSFCT